MDTLRRWIRYDTFKLIIALILLIILIILLLNLQNGQTKNSLNIPISQANSSTSAVAATNTLEMKTALLPSPSPTQIIQTSSTPIPQPSATSTQHTQPTTAPTLVPQPTATLEPSPTVVPQPTATQAATSSPVDCPKALPPRLKVGIMARITTPLNLRTSPEIANNLITTNPDNTQLAIIGGPVCTPYLNGAYLWWNVQLSDGKSGWSAEGSLTGSFYFLEPIP